MKLLGYIRVSTDEQARAGQSLSQQPQQLRAYCALHGHTLVDVIADEGVSASTALAKRGGGRQLLQRLKAGDAEGVVVVRLDRLFRDALDGLGFFRLADKQRLAVHSVSELVDSSTPAGKLALTIQLGAAQYERDLAVQRATDCNAALRAAGMVYGTVPYGCLAVEQGGERYLRRDRIVWAERERIVADLREGLSLRAVASRLYLRDVPSPTGKRRWSPSTLSELRTNHDSLAALPFAGESATGTPVVNEAAVSAGEAMP